MRYMPLTLLVLLVVSHAPAEDRTPAAREYQALLDQVERQGGAPIFAARFVEFAEQHRQDPAATDALLWVVKNVPGRRDATRALELLEKDHLESEKLGPACADIVRSRSVAAERLLRAVLDRSPHREVRAQACYYLALLLDTEANILDQLKQQPELAPRVLQYYGSDYGKHLSSLDPPSLAKARQQVYERMLESFPETRIQDNRLGEFAEKALFALRHLSVGSVAPDIEGEDIHGKPFRLRDYRGKIVMLTFWGHW